MVFPNDWEGFSPAIMGRVMDYLWHEHRIPILLSTAFILTFLRFYLRLNDAQSEQQKLVALPRALNKDEKKTTTTTTEKLDKVVVKKVSGSEGSSGDDEKKEGVKKKSAGPRRIKGDASKRVKKEGGEARKIQVLVFFSCLTGSTEKIVKQFAGAFEEALTKAKGEQTTFLPLQVLDLSEVDYDEYFISPPKTEGEEKVDYFYLILLPSFNIDSINDTFLEHLQETHHDFRIDTSPLAPILGYSVFGFGDREGWPTEEEGYCFQAKEVDKWMAKLSGRKRAYPLGMGDWKRDGKERLAEWKSGLVDVLGQIEQNGGLGEGVPGSGDPIESDDEELDDDGEVYDEGAEQNGKSKSSGDLGDLEDLGQIMAASGNTGKKSSGPIAVDFTIEGKPKRKAAAPAVIKEMVPKGSPTYNSLTKQGYAIVGSHSGVKICRWTKSALRGRGSCYKYSFYGINSHQCMETTPSLSCSNKCVFCWRHGTNPVGTNWRWVVDPPDLIFNGVKENHYKKIKMMRGVPGVRAERFAEAMRIRHCALSLVGEPIFYPHINEFLGMLHKERISSFLVCNAQHPDQLAALQHVTQLYVSIDASNKESLRRIDRPLHRDFWERFNRCLDILRERRFQQRTVFRLTLVKDFNLEDEVEGYADLVQKGLPCFVEIKGVTYCGTSTSSSAGLTMQNVPFYNEVCDFVVALEKALKKRGLNYGIAAEHAHSCCILLASDRFHKEGKWHTRIDYERFFKLLEERGPDGEFTPEEYMGPETPEWATWGRGGFDPRDQRVDRKGRPVEVS
ncbi:Fe-S oxidoreductase [Podospora pseudopauciseta]|uniref:tRNA 4-demethylwyosine synthase (AdoMet-dependent) n=1 Tax=Podospora pseudopauciseta TaxID=2093780 RepID=A0ABR0H4Y6_9PEZI|nr:Fe-S oxidoreductase [Podospora pseudopauciseta]